MNRFIAVFNRFTSLPNMISLSVKIASTGSTWKSNKVNAYCISQYTYTSHDSSSCL